MPEERSSDLYTQPEDRRNFDEEKSDVSFGDEVNELPDLGDPVNESKKQVEFTSEEIALKKSKNSFGWFVAFCIIDLAFAAYIIYIVITVFSHLG